MKKLIAILLCGIMVLGLFAGCNNNSQGNNGTNPPATNPGGKTILTIGMPTSITIENYDTNSLTVWLEEQLDCEIVIQPYATSSADAKTQLATQLLDDSIKLPDILLNFSLGDSVWKQYGEDGYLVDLTEYFYDKEGKSKIWWDRLTELGLPQQHTDAIIERCKADDGKVYAFPRIEECKIDTMAYLAQINVKWLQEVGKKKEDIKTWEDFLEVMELFKTKICDVKGTGWYPIFGQNSTSICQDFVAWVINFDCYYDTNVPYVFTDDTYKTIKPVYITDEYRKGLQRVAELVDKGYLPANFFSASGTDVKNVLNHESGEAHCGFLIHHPTVVYLIDSPATWEFEALDLYGYCVREENLNSIETFITEDCVDVDLAWELIMTLNTAEGAYRTRYGERGLNWDWADADAGKSYLGLDCDMKIVGHDYWGKVNNYMWNDIPSVILPNAELESIQLTDASDWLLRRLNSITGPAYKYFKENEENVNPERIVPVMVKTEAEKEETQVESGNIGSVRSSWLTKFVKRVDKGTHDIYNDTHWANYIAELEKVGLDVYMAQMQKIYTDRYYERVLSGELFS